MNCTLSRHSPVLATATPTCRSTDRMSACSGRCGDAAGGGAAAGIWGAAAGGTGAADATACPASLGACAREDWWVLVLRGLDPAESAGQQFNGQRTHGEQSTDRTAAIHRSKKLEQTPAGKQSHSSSPAHTLCSPSSPPAAFDRTDSRCGEAPAAPAAAPAATLLLRRSRSGPTLPSGALSSRRAAAPAWSSPGCCPACCCCSCCCWPWLAPFKST